MFTRCPHCQTRFRVSAAQLKAGRGQVRCGRCQQVFDALAYLAADEPGAAESQDTAASPSPQPAAPAKPTPPPSRPTAGAKPAPKPATAPRRPPQPKAATTQPRIEPPRPKNGDLFAEPQPPAAGMTTVAPPEPAMTPVPPPVAEQTDAPEAVTVPPGKPTPTPVPADADTTAPDQAPDVDDTPPERPLPFQLEPDATATRGTRHLGWTLGSLLLIALLGAQYVYARRLDMVNYPLLRPWLEQACQYTGCHLPAHRAPGQILMLDNTVQTHPRIPDALLITATLINKASFDQPYPVLEVDMLNVDQKVVARRRFLPWQYLTHGDDDPQGLMDSDTEAHVQLEVADPGTEAVGFRFELL